MKNEQNRAEELVCTLPRFFIFGRRRSPFPFRRARFYAFLTNTRHAFSQILQKGVTKSEKCAIMKLIWARAHCAPSDNFCERVS